MKNEINMKKLNEKRDREKRTDRHWYTLSKLKLFGNFHRCVTSGQH